MCSPDAVRRRHLRIFAGKKKKRCCWMHVLAHTHITHVHHRCNVLGTLARMCTKDCCFRIKSSHACIETHATQMPLQTDICTHSHYCRCTKGHSTRHTRTHFCRTCRWRLRIFASIHVRTRCARQGTCADIMCMKDANDAHWNSRCFREGTYCYQRRHFFCTGPASLIS